MPKHLLGHPRVWIRVLTKRVHLVLTEETVAARDRKRHHHAIADLEIRYFASDLNDLTHELVTENVAALHRRNEAVVHVQVRSANRRRRDLHDRVALVQYLRLGHVFNAETRLAIPTICFHYISPPSTRSRCR